jgi:hypothetical protein
VFIAVSEVVVEKAILVSLYKDCIRALWRILIFRSPQNFIDIADERGIFASVMHSHGICLGDSVMEIRVNGDGEI